MQKRLVFGMAPGTEEMGQDRYGESATKMLDRDVVRLDQVISSTIGLDASMLIPGVATASNEASDADHADGQPGLRILGEAAHQVRGMPSHGDGPCGRSSIITQRHDRCCPRRAVVVCVGRESWGRAERGQK